MINAEKNQFYCHGCKKGGNSIDLASWLLGCDFKRTISILSQDFNISNVSTQTKEIIEAYDYLDANDNLIYQVVRQSPKGFRQRRPDGNGGWIWDLKGVIPVPYNLPNVMSAIMRQESIYIVEGEKDADNLNKLGFTATCNSGGAGKWAQNHTKYFSADVEVIILPDNDTAGRDHALSISKQLMINGCKVKIINLPDIDKIATEAGLGSENKADISDWLAAGYTKENLSEVVERTKYSASEESTKIDIEEAILTLESLPQKGQAKYFKEVILPILATSGAVERAQTVKKIAKILEVSLQVISEEIRATTNASSDDKNQAEILTEIALSNTLFHDDLGEPYTLIEFKDYNRIVKIGQGRDFIRYISGEYYKRTGLSPYNEAIRQAINIAEYKAIFEGQECKLQLRVANYDKAFWYDLADEKNRAIKITPGGWQIVDKPPILFKRRNNQEKQIEPMQGIGNIEKLADFINLDNDDLKLLMIYLVSTFIPNIPHPIPLFHGEKGAAKSTSMQFVRRLTDPSKRELFSLPKEQKELAQQLSGNYMPCYDNLSDISQMHSDLLCGAVTSGGVMKRKLYSDEDDVILSFFCCPVLNGISVVAHATDLLDRCLLFELRRISEEKRQEINKIFADFETARPAIFTGILDILSKAMSLYPLIKLKQLPRMADFAKWGYAIAEALGIGGDNFISLYRKNRDMINIAAIEENPIATAVVGFMNDRIEFGGTMTELYNRLSGIAEALDIDTKSKDWPKQSNALSRKMTEIKSNLLDVGISYSSYRTKQGVHVELSRKIT